MFPFIKYTLLFLIVFLGIYTDQSSKNWASHNLKDRPVKVAVHNFLEFGYTENHGMVFGINNRSNNIISKNILLAIRMLLSIVLIVVIVVNRNKKIIFHFPFLLILSGAIGNVIDSMRFGHVIDFIHMHAGKLVDWPFLYNLADAYVCIGMGILLLQSLFPNEGRKKNVNITM